MRISIANFILIIASIAISAACIYQNSIVPLVFYILGLVISIFTDGDTKEMKKASNV